MSMLDPVPEEEAVGPSNRAFGLTFCVVFLLIALVPLWRGGPIRVWALAISATCCALALLLPAVLTPANRAWLALGLAMHRVVNPIVMGALFYLVVTPFGVVMRLFGRGLASRLRPEPAAPSYWTPRTTASSMDQQF